MRLLAPVFAAVLGTAAVAGCAHQIDGKPQPGNSHISRPIAGGELDSVLLTPAQVTDIVGAKVDLRADISRPVTGDPVEGPCAALDTVGMNEVVGDHFSAFHLLLLADGTGREHDHVVTQSAAVYPDAATAAKAFVTATSALPSCDKKEFKTDATWRFAVNDLSADSMKWNKEQTDLPILWVCHGQSRVRDNILMQAMACQGDDGGEHNADAVLNRMSATVWVLSGG
jgi:hypothetical protein